MKSPIFMICGVLLACSTAGAQVGLVSDNYFPASLEFQELQKVTSEEIFEDPARLSNISDGRLFSDVGFDRYARRVYAAGDSHSVSIEVVTLRDSRAAYSLLTLLRNSSVQGGPPGDAYTLAADAIRFAQDKQWVRIQGRGASEDLLRRVANSVSNRIGTQRQKAPLLISHLPKPDCDAASLRYFPGLKAYEYYAGNTAAGYLQPGLDMEIAQARCSLDSLGGVLSLLSFPTTGVAEEYVAKLSDLESDKKNTNGMYVKRAGPIVAILDGAFDPNTADKILRTLKFSYSIRWMIEKRNKPKTIWGIPAGILGTVVSSLIFVALLCGASIVLGIGSAVCRFALRSYAPNNPLDRPERTEITRLRLR
jgi:hypothetical protein